jgi:hypothetical protein
LSHLSLELRAFFVLRILKRCLLLPSSAIIFGIFRGTSMVELALCQTPSFFRFPEIVTLCPPASEFERDSK